MPVMASHRNDVRRRLQFNLMIPNTRIPIHLRVLFSIIQKQQNNTDRMWTEMNRIEGTCSGSYSLDVVFCFVLVSCESQNFYCFLFAPAYFVHFHFPSWRKNQFADQWCAVDPAHVIDLLLWKRTLQAIWGAKPLGMISDNTYTTGKKRNPK